MVKAKYFFSKLSTTNVKKRPKLDFDWEIRVRMRYPLLRPPLENAIFAHFRPFQAKCELSPEVKIDAE